MQFYATTLVALMAALTAYASPTVGLRSVNLDNGEQTVTTQVEVRSVLEGRDDYNCKGSSLCSTKQSFKDECSSAYSKIEDTNYTPGGTKSGVCSGHCGIFIQSYPGKTCPVGATGQDLRNSYNAIRSNGCQACGSDVNGDCEVTINYVASC